MRHRRSGFTLIELIVVVGVLIIVAAMVPGLTSGPILDREMYNAAAQFQQDLLLVQNMAVTHSSGGPPGGSPRYLMRLYLGDNAFAYETTETYSAPTPSVPSPSSGIVMRRMTSVFGFPAFFGTAPPASVTIGSTNVTSSCVDVVFDNQGLPYWRWQISGGVWAAWTSPGTAGSIMVTNRSASKQIQVTVSVIGRVSIAWVQGHR